MNNYFLLIFAVLLKEADSEGNNNAKRNESEDFMNFINEFEKHQQMGKNSRVDWAKLMADNNKMRMILEYQSYLGADNVESFLAKHFKNGKSSESIDWSLPFPTLPPYTELTMTISSGSSSSIYSHESNNSSYNTRGSSNGIIIGCIIVVLILACCGAICCKMCAKPEIQYAPRAVVVVPTVSKTVPALSSGSQDFRPPYAHHQEFRQPYTSYPITYAPPPPYSHVTANM